jgi:hypothetical protein
MWEGLEESSPNLSRLWAQGIYAACEIG